MTDQSINQIREIWKPIPDWNGYFASDIGNIKSSAGILKQHSSGKFIYPQVYLSSNGKRKTCKVHRLIMAAFHGKSTMNVNHINSDRTDNTLANLEYVTPRENSLHAIKSKKGLTGASFYPSKNRWCAEITLKGKGKKLGYFKTQIEAHNRYMEELYKIEPNTRYLRVAPPTNPGGGE